MALGLGPLPEAVRELVDEDAAILEPSTRERLRELILREAVGLGPLEELLADPAVEEVMVNGHERVYVERRGRIERTEVSFAVGAVAAGRDRADPDAAGPAGRRAQPDGGREARGRFSGPRRDPAARGGRPVAVDPPLLGRAARAHGSWSSSARSPRSSTTSSAAAVGGAAEHPGQRRHRLGQDDAAQRAVGLHRSRPSG